MPDESNDPKHGGTATKRGTKKKRTKSKSKAPAKSKK
jgi:hypothetical protein